MPARSLLAMSTRVAAQNVRSLTDIGNIPFSLARPFLIKIESPRQLRELEKNSPHIMQEDRELWIDFIKRDIPQWEQYDLPKESDCWYDIYCDLLEQVQREVEEGAMQLKQAVDKFYSDKASNAAVLVKDTNRLPKPKRRFHNFGSIRSEPKKNSIFSSKRNKVLTVPTHQLHSNTSQISHVPQWLVDEHKQVSPNSAATAANRRQSNASTGTSQGASSPTASTHNVTNGRPTSRVSAPRPRIVTKTQPAPNSVPIIPSRKRSLDRSPPRPQSVCPESNGTPTRASPMSPPKQIIRKRPTASQPNVFIQQKKRKT